MTGRRSTRAASSRASSVARSEIGQATPRRSTRSHPLFEGSPLPPALPTLASVPTRGSTSYGSSIAALPADFRRSGRGGDLTETLTDILGTVQENIQATYGFIENRPDQSNDLNPKASSGSKARSSRKGSRAPSNTSSGTNGPGAKDTRATGRNTRGARDTSESSTPSANNTISYVNESELYEDATFTDDLLAGFRKSGKKGAKPLIVEEDENEEEDDEEDEEEDEEQSEEQNEEDNEEDEEQTAIEPPTDRASPWMQLNAWLGRLYEPIVSRVGTSAIRFFATLSSLAQRILSRWGVLVLVLAVLGVLGVASFFTASPTTDPLFEDDRKPGFDISHQIRQWLPSSRSRPLSYFSDPISDLQGRMFVVENDLKSLKRHVGINKAAIEYLENILPDQIYLSKGAGETEPAPNFWKGLAHAPKPSKDKSETVPGSDWDDFIAQNEAKVKVWLAETSEDLWGQRLKETLQDHGTLVSRSEVIEMIRKRWDQSELNLKNVVKDELRMHTKFFSKEGFIKQQDAVDLFNELTIKALAKDEEWKRISSLNTQEPNHFSFGLGAVVNPSLTSPTYAFAKARAWWPTRLLLWSVGYGLPSPNPPSEALTKWDEPGDCWCSPMKGLGAGVQLGVLMTHNIVPKSVVIEHVPKLATFDSSSAPRDMELWAEIDDHKAMRIAGDLSDLTFQDHHEPYLSKEWVLIGTWRYNLEGSSHVQYFQPQIDLGELNTSTRQLIIRAKNNQGHSDHTCLYRVRVFGKVTPKVEA